VGAYRAALAIKPNAAGAYNGLGSALKDIDPAGAAVAFAAAAKDDGEGSEASDAQLLRKWLASAVDSETGGHSTSSEGKSKSNGHSEPTCSGRSWAAVQTAARYPDVFSGRATACESMSIHEATALGSEALLKRGPTLLSNASDGWRLRKWTDEVPSPELSAW
jgi:hypothetical protein